MTADRDELKFLLEPRRARLLCKLVAEHLPAHRFAGPNANRLPNAQHYVTTIYFDTRERHIYRDCQHGDANLKLRAKEYYDLHPDLVELATDAADLVRYIPILWIETKSREGTRTRKKRLGLPKHEVSAFFADGVITESMVEIQKAQHGSLARDVLEEMAKLCSRFHSPLEADCLVNYRRKAWQDERGVLRITLDSGLSFFEPPRGIWQRKTALVHGSLGSRAGRVSQHVLEVKTRASMPMWLAEFLEGTGAAMMGDARFSKFLAASGAVHSG